MDRLLSTKFTLGGDATVAAGPVGRSTQAETDAAMTAEILTWSRSRGLFAGISLNGATLREDDDWNKELYGHRDQESRDRHRQHRSARRRRGRHGRVEQVLQPQVAEEVDADPIRNIESGKRDARGLERARPRRRGLLRRLRPARSGRSRILRHRHRSHQRPGGRAATGSAGRSEAPGRLSKSAAGRAG